MALINVDLSDTIESWRVKTNEIATKQGDLSLLTDSASNIVAAINGLKVLIDSNYAALSGDYATSTDLSTEISGVNTTIGTLSSLTTTDKTDIVSAINELDGRLINVYNSSGTLLNT